MTQPWTWRPPPTWTLKLARGDVDLTPLTLEWDVAYGCSFDAAAGQWAVQTATGSLVLDNRSRAFEPGSPDAIITSGDVAVPQLVVLSLGAGGETLWQGAAVLKAAAHLRGDATVVWRLHGYYWQVLRSPLEWRQIDNTDAGSTPYTVTRRILRDAVDGAPALDITSRASVYPDVIRFQDLTLAETGGAAWNRLGQAMGCIPFEDSNGLLGMSAMHRMAEGQQRVVPDTMRALDDSTLQSVGTMSLWSIDVVTRDFAPAPLSVLVTTGAGASTRSEVIRYDYPDDVVGVEWAPPTPTAAGWSIATWRALPAQDGSRADTVRCVIVRDNDQAQPSGVTYRGRVLSPTGGRTISLAHPPIAAAGLLRSRRQTTPPWVVHGAVGYLAPFEAMLGFVNEQKVTATLRYPLWAPTEEDRLPTHLSGDRQGLLVPGSMSRYRIDADRQIDMITGLVHLQGSAVDEPSATITGVTYSAASEFTGLPLDPLPDDLPRPWMIPPPGPPVYGPTPLPPLPPPTLTTAGPGRRGRAGRVAARILACGHRPRPHRRTRFRGRGHRLGRDRQLVPRRQPGQRHVGLPAALRRCVGAVGHHHSGAADARLHRVVETQLDHGPRVCG